MRMRNIPKWILEIVDADERICSKCNKKISSADIALVGAQESTNHYGKASLACGFYCSKCKEIEVVEFDNIIVDISTMKLIEKISMKDDGLYEEYSFNYEDDSFDDEDESFNNDDDIRRQIREALDSAKRKFRGDSNDKENFKRQSKITYKEIQEVKDFLDSMTYSHELLEAMGLTPEEIEEYSKIDDENKKNDKKNEKGK